MIKTITSTTPAQDVEVITTPIGQIIDLETIATEIESTLDTIESHEGAFLDATLEHRLLVGLHVTKAMEAFSLTNAESGTLGGRGNKSESRRDSLSEDAADSTENDEETTPASFVQWLCKTSSRLQKPTAYKYAKAFRGLGLDHRASPEQLRMTLETLRYSNKQANLPAPNLAALIKAAPRLPKPAKQEISEPEDSATIRLGDAREALHLWQEDWEKIVKKGQLDDLEKKDLEALREFLLSIRDRVNNRLKSA